MCMDFFWGGGRLCVGGGGGGKLHGNNLIKLSRAN